MLDRRRGDYAYWMERARASLAAAKACADPCIASLHMELRERHLARATYVAERARLTEAVLHRINAARAARALDGGWAASDRIVPADAAISAPDEGKIRSPAIRRGRSGMGAASSTRPVHLVGA